VYAVKYVTPLIPLLATALTEGYIGFFNPTDGRMFGLSRLLDLPRVRLAPTPLLSLKLLPHLALTLTTPAVFNLGLFVTWGALHSLSAQPWFQRGLYAATPAPLRALLFNSKEDRVFGVFNALTLIPLMACWQTTLGDDRVMWSLPLPDFPVPYLQQPFNIVVCDAITTAISFYIFSGPVRQALNELPLPTRVDTNVSLFGNLPQEQQPQKRRVVSTGWHGLVRHPLYTLLMSSLLLSAHMSTQRLWLMLDYFVYLAVAVPLEEARCIKEFGQEYIDYKKKVPYKFIPYLF
jgi:hypothetical protein